MVASTTGRPLAAPTPEQPLDHLKPPRRLAGKHALRLGPTAGASDRDRFPDVYGTHRSLSMAWGSSILFQERTSLSPRPLVERMNPLFRRGVLTSLLCAGLHFSAQAQATSGSAVPFAGTMYVFTWKSSLPGCDRFYVNGQNIESLSTTQALVQISPGPVIDKFGIFVLVENPANSSERIEVLPEHVHLFKVSTKGLSEVERFDATRIAKSMERRERIGESIAAGLSAAGSQTTATGTATYSDGTTANYSVTVPNPQAQSDSINRARDAIAAARERGGAIVASELQRNTLFPGQKAIGQLFFLRQKVTEDLLIRVTIANVSYEFPYHLSKNGSVETRDVAASSEIALTREEVEIAPNEPPNTADAHGIRSPESNTNYSDALETYRKGANHGDPEAEFQIGLLYSQGHGVSQDYAQAAAWYRKAADHGEPSAQAALGALYFLGEGVPQDFADAATWFRKAADAGVIRAQYMLGTLYASGRGVQQDYAEAYFWLDIAAAGCREKDRVRFAKARDEAAAKLSPSVLSDEQKRATDWSENRLPRK